MAKKRAVELAEKEREKGLKKIRKKLQKAGFDKIEANIFRKSVQLTGEVDSWDKKVTAGFLAVSPYFKGVLNDLTVPNLVQDDWKIPTVTDTVLDGQHFDVVIIGGGVTGASILRELSRYDLRIALFEKESDVAMQTSSRNDGMIHPGFAAHPGSLKAYYNVRGNAAYPQLCKELGIPMVNPGSVMLFKTPLYKLIVPFLKQRAKKNGVPGCRYLSRKEIEKQNPYLAKRCYGGFFMKTASQLSPYGLVVALAENAIENKAEVYLNTLVDSMELQDLPQKEGDLKSSYVNQITKIKTNRGCATAGIVINAAGVWADRIAQMADDRFFSIHYRKGTELILDLKTEQYLQNMMAMPNILQKGRTSKGGGLVKTVEGNVLVGPNAFEQPMREDFSTDIESVKELSKHVELNSKLSSRDIITYFSGIRAATWEEDFVIEPSERVENLIHVAGIQSPGLASAPAISKAVVSMATEMLSRKKEVKEREDFNPIRQHVIPNVNKMSREEREALIQKDPAYGRIVCRCEAISEGEIRDAVRSPLPANSVDGIKRRARAGAGRCHGGFCMPRVLEILSKESGVPIEDLTRKGDGSFLFFGRTKELSNGTK